MNDLDLCKDSVKSIISFEWRRLRVKHSAALAAKDELGVYDLDVRMDELEKIASDFDIGFEELI